MGSFKPFMGSLLFAGTIVGAGILGLPYALAQSGLLGGIFLLIVGAFFAYLTATYIGVLVYHQHLPLPLHLIVRKYLGKDASYLTLAAIIFTSYGALIAYPLAVASILKALFSFPPWISMILFLGLMFLLVSQNLGSGSKINAGVTLLLALLLIGIMIKAIPYLEVQNFLYFRPGSLLSGWGVIIFAFAGHMVIPTVLYYVETTQQQGIRVLLYGIIGVFLLFLGFFIVSIGVMGIQTTPVATNGLGEYLSATVAAVGQIFALLAIVTSFFGITISLRQTFEKNSNIHPMISLATIFIPIIILDLLLGGGEGESFFRVLNYAGGIGSSLFAGVIPALVVISIRNAYRFPYGMNGAYAAVIFYGLAIIYTIIS
ncbi:MAG: aromatic amino acid transport family protein [Bacillota bacterium]|nr:aromatic amino acid transport family protein [Bacillota bacterium]